METIGQKPGLQSAIDQLRGEALSAEDQAYLDEEQAKLDQERTDLGLNTTATEVGQIVLPDFVLGPGGAAVPKAEVHAAIEAGQEVFEDGNRRG